jgi:hypothetical protein
MNLLTGQNRITFLLPVAILGSTLGGFLLSPFLLRAIQPPQGPLVEAVKNPQTSDDFVALANYQIRSPLATKREGIKALASCDRAVALDSNNPEAYACRALILPLVDSNNRKLAEKQLQKAVELWNSDKARIVEPKLRNAIETSRELPDDRLPTSDQEL